MSQTIQKIIFIVVVLGVVIFFGYKIFIEVPDMVVTGTGESVNGEIVGQDILTLVEKLKAISIDQSIFSSTLFSSLKDSETTLVSESVGRTNPFASIGSSFAPVSAGPTTIKK
jgi:hypothetical protein